MDTDGVSTFLVHSAELETFVAAAFQLRRGASPKNPAVLVRIPLFEIFVRRIRVEPTPGDLGVVEADWRHRDLHATGGVYVSLTTKLLAQRMLGKDNVRDIPADLLRHHIERIAAMSDAEASLRTRKAAAAWLTKIKPRVPPASGGHTQGT